MVVRLKACETVTMERWGLKLSVDPSIVTTVTATHKYVNWIAWVHSVSGVAVQPPPQVGWGPCERHRQG